MVAICKLFLQIPKCRFQCTFNGFWGWEILRNLCFRFKRATTQQKVLKKYLNQRKGKENWSTSTVEWYGAIADRLRSPAAPCRRGRDCSRADACAQISPASPYSNGGCAGSGNREATDVASRHPTMRKQEAWLPTALRLRGRRTCLAAPPAAGTTTPCPVGWVPRRKFSFRSSDLRPWLVLYSNFCCGVGSW